jgi:hypothetical protein
MKDSIVIKAILELNPNIGVTVNGYETVDECFNNAIFENEADKTMSLEDVKAKVSEIETAEANSITEKQNLKASAKAKLIAGEALTEDEANELVGL